MVYQNVTLSFKDATFYYNETGSRSESDTSKSMPKDTGGSDSVVGRVLQNLTPSWAARDRLCSSLVVNFGFNPLVNFNETFRYITI